MGGLVLPYTFSGPFADLLTKQLPSWLTVCIIQELQLFRDETRYM